MTTENTTEKMLDEEVAVKTSAPTTKTETRSRIGAFWKREKNGETFLSGELEIDGKKINVALFKNNKKEKPNHPDFNLVLSRTQPSDKEFI